MLTVVLMFNSLFNSYSHSELFKEISVVSDDFLCKKKMSGILDKEKINLGCGSQHKKNIYRHINVPYPTIDS